MNPMSEDAKAILLLCGRFADDTGSEPLEQTAYNRVAQWLVSRNLRPADLLDPGQTVGLAVDTGLAEDRLAVLLNRGLQLGLAVEGWNRSGIWVVCRSDSEYPARFKLHLKDKAPPVLFGAGNMGLLRGGGLAVVGSRNADKEAETFAGEVAAWAAAGRMPIVSGGARGVDQLAMAAALEAGGTVIGVLADSLLRASVSRDARSAIAEERLLLVSPYHPKAGFSVGTAMARNKLIYALADFGLVVSTDFEKGGTWAGASEELKRKDGRPIFVRLEGEVPEGNRKLIRLGAIGFSALPPGEDPREFLARSVAEQQPAVGPPSAFPLFDNIPAPPLPPR